MNKIAKATALLGTAASLVGLTPTAQATIVEFIVGSTYIGANTSIDGVTVRSGDTVNNTCSWDTVAGIGSAKEEIFRGENLIYSFTSPTIDLSVGQTVSYSALLVTSDLSLPNAFVINLFNHNAANGGVTLNSDLSNLQQFANLGGSDANTHLYISINGDESQFNSLTVTTPAIGVPEPTTAVLLGLGGVGLFGLGRFGFKKKTAAKAVEVA